MILDAEMAGAVRRVLRGFDVSDDTLAVDLIAAKGAGGLYTGEVHTAEHFRRELWQPTVWSREMLAGGARTDAHRALDLWHDLMREPDFEPGLDDATASRLRRVIASVPL